MDIKAIQTSPTYTCIREISITPMFQATFQATSIQAIACKDYDDLVENYQKSFIYCFNNVHHLPYYPKTKLKDVRCQQIKTILQSYIAKDNIVFYKNGTHEKRLCDQMQILSINIKQFGVPNVKNISSSCYEQCDGHVKEGLHCPSVEIKKFRYFLSKYCKEGIYKLLHDQININLFKLN